MMRPVDLNAAMRADLVHILRDVVGLIARIEASIPAAASEILQPAAFATAQNEGVVDQGEDQRAQKEGAGRLPSAGAAKAGHVEADPRNSSRPAEEVASAPPSADRTPASNQPTDAAPPCVVTAEPPAAPSASPQPAPQEAQPTKTEQALDLWSTTDLTEEQIAARVGCAVGSVKGFVYAARKKDDPRAFARKMAHDEKLSQPPAPKVEKPVLIKHADDEPPVAGFAKPVERKPFDRPTSSPLNPRPGRVAGVVIDKPGSVVSIDTLNFVVACPGGDWQTSRPVSLVMERMRNGETFADHVLAELGSMGTDSFRESRKRWAEQLASLGITFVHTPHVGCRIEVAK